jgi:hypothetical protein
MKQGVPLDIAMDHGHLPKPELDRWKAAKQRNTVVFFLVMMDIQKWQINLR